MNEANTNYLKQHIDILSFRDLAPGTVATYSSYMTQFIDWAEASLPDKPIPDISWEEICSFLRYLKEVRTLNPRTVNVHIAQLRDFYQYVLHRDWDRYQVPYLHYDELLPKVPSKSERIEGVAYYHLIFTVPSELNHLMYANQKLLYDLLFKCDNDTILTLCKDSNYMGATPGIISVLHSWASS